MDALTFIKEEDRLIDNCNIECNECRLDEKNNGLGVKCFELKPYYTDKYVEIMEKWSQDCPVETYKSKFLKAFPDANIYTIFEELTLEDIYGKVANAKCSGDSEFYCDFHYDCEKCWDKVIMVVKE